MSSTFHTTTAFLRFARAYAAEQLPWFAPALFRCNIVVTNEVKVAAIDNKLNVYFNPAVVDDIQGKHDRKSALAQVGFLWIHEISHILREHSSRAKELTVNVLEWNMAADFEINDGQWLGLQMPIDYPGLLPQNFNFPAGQIAEVYYTKHIGQRKRGEAFQQMTSNSWDEGSGVHGKNRPWEVHQETQLANADLINELTLSVIRQQVAEKMRRAGRLPGSWSRWVNEILNPKVDWRKVLQHRVRTAINISNGRKIDYSYQKYNRRQTAFRPIILPALSEHVQANAAVIVDTSGSMSTTMLGQATAEVCALLETFRIPVTVIPCDARAYEPIQIRSSFDYVKLMELKGGGGTNMNAGIDAALTLRPRPDVIIVLTDGYTPWPTKQIAIPTVFGILHQAKPDFPKPPMPPWKAESVVGIDVAEN